jgi:hypothetical protein
VRVQIQTQDHLATALMAWEPLRVEGSEGKAWIKSLAMDPEDGSRTVLFKFDPGYRQAAATSDLPADIYVLEGGMKCGELVFGVDTYHYRPAGTAFGPIESPEGCTRLVFTQGGDRKSPAEAVFVQDVKQLPWGADTLDVQAQRRGQKTLRLDEESGIWVRTGVIWEPGLRGLDGMVERHDYQEEVYTLEGALWHYLESVDGRVLTAAGTYSCRAPHESWHGDTITIDVPIRVVVRLDYSTSTMPMDVEQHAALLEEKRKQGIEDDGLRRREPVTFVE